MFKFVLSVLIVLGSFASVLAQSDTPVVEVVLSTDQAQQGDTIYADVVIRNGHAIAGADVGITSDNCLRMVERQPGNYLPSTSENGGFSPFAELNDTSMRFAVTVTDRTKLADGDGVLFRAMMEVSCEDAKPSVAVTFAEIATLADPNSTKNDLVGYSLEQGNLTVVSDSVEVHVGAVASTPAPITTAPVTSPAAQNMLVYVAIIAVVLSVVGLIVLFVIYQRRQNARRS